MMEKHENITRAEALDFMKKGYKIKHSGYADDEFIRMDEYGMIRNENNYHMGHEDDEFWQSYQTWPSGWTAFK